MTSPLLFLAIAAAGGLGAALRLLVDGAVRSASLRARWLPFPLATTVINVTGSFGLGLLTGLAASAGMPHEWLLVGGGGLMGGYTTFSTASVETVRLLGGRRWAAGLLAGVGMLVLSVAAALLGLVVGGAWRGGGLAAWAA